MVSVKTIPVAFPTTKRRTLRGALYVPAKYSTAVVLLHGFPSDSSGGTHRRALGLARAGFLALRFDFTGCGLSDGKHEERLQSQDLKDTRAAIDFLSRTCEYDRLVLHGHSTGAVDAVLYSSSDKRIDAVISSGGQAYLDQGVKYDFTDEQIRELRRRGYTLTPYAMRWSGKRERIVKKFYDEFFTLDIPRAIRQFHRPLLIIHGERDRALPAARSRELYAIANQPKKLVIVKGAGHNFEGAKKAQLAALIRFLRGLERRAHRTRPRS